MVKYVFIANEKNLIRNDHIILKVGFVHGERGLGYGLLSNENEVSWRKPRRVMNPAFYRKCLRDSLANFNTVCERFLVRMDMVVNGGKPVSMVSGFGKITLETISEVSFNLNTNVMELPHSPFPNAIQNYFQAIQDNIDIPLSPTLLAIFQFKIFQNDTKKQQIHAAQFLRKFTLDCIIARKLDIAGNKDAPNDLLSTLIKGGGLSADEIADEFLTIFVAGQETTANTLSFALFEICNHPHVEAKLLSEINEVLGGRDYIEFNDLAKLRYLGQVCEETLRKHPVAIAPLRVTTKPITVGGYCVPKGIGVGSNQLFFAMDPEIWENPEVFDPERFANVENIQNFTTTHFPFSIGRHTCIGQNFAKFELKVVLAKLVRKFQFRLLPDQTDQIAERTTLIPRDGVICDVTRR